MHYFLLIWSVHQKLNHVNSVQFSYITLYVHSMSPKLHTEQQKWNEIKAKPKHTAFISFHFCCSVCTLINITNSSAGDNIYVQAFHTWYKKTWLLATAQNKACHTYLCTMWFVFWYFPVKMVRIQSRSLVQHSFIEYWKQPMSAIIIMSFREDVTVVMSISPTNHKHIIVQNSENWTTMNAGQQQVILVSWNTATAMLASNMTRSITKD